MKEIIEGEEIIERAKIRERNVKIEKESNMLVVRVAFVRRLILYRNSNFRNFSYISSG